MRIVVGSHDWGSEMVPLGTLVSGELVAEELAAGRAATGVVALTVEFTGEIGTVGSEPRGYAEDPVDVTF